MKIIKSLYRVRSLCVITLSLLVWASAAASTDEPSFTSIDFPGARATRAFGINPAGDIVGSYTDATGVHGYLLSNGSFTSFDFPGATFTVAHGINPRGDIIGRYGTPGRTHGFLLTQHGFTNIDVPGHRHTLPTKINPRGDIVGCFHDTNFLMDMRGYVQRGGRFTSFDLLDSSMHNGITPGGGKIVGVYFEMNGTTHGYLLTRGSFTQIDFPGATQTASWDINPAGEIVGVYGDAAGTHGFLLDRDGFTSIDVPGAISTLAFGINPAGAIVGWYTDATGQHGYLLSRGDRDDDDRDDD